MNIQFSGDELSEIGLSLCTTLVRREYLNKQHAISGLDKITAILKEMNLQKIAAAAAAANTANATEQNKQENK